MSLDLFVNIAGFSAYLGALIWSLWLGRWSSDPEKDLPRFRRAARLPWWAIAVSVALVAHAAYRQDIAVAVIWFVNGMGAALFIQLTRRASVEHQRRVHFARKAQLAIRKIEQGQHFRRG